MQCGHCSADYHPQTSYPVLGQDATGVWRLETEICPRCRKFNIRLARGIQGPTGFHAAETFVVYPKGGVTRTRAATEVPKNLADDYNEGCLVLSDSPKASAALSRRCLQNLLREHAKVKHQNLNAEID